MLYWYTFHLPPSYPTTSETYENNKSCYTQVREKVFKPDILSYWCYFCYQPLFIPVVCFLYFILLNHLQYMLLVAYGFD